MEAKLISGNFLKYELLQCHNGPHSDFIYELRTDPVLKRGFKSQEDFTLIEHREYMKKNLGSYIVLLMRESALPYMSDGGEGQIDVFRPVGYGGVVNGDIRFCVSRKDQGKGLGCDILSTCHRVWPKAIGRIFPSNKASIRAFIKAKVPFILIENPNDTKKHNT